ncbi:hypothetical protein [Peribacillus frigoritolerans]|uniref:hypothetical protein n=1 Tax=Peribacillus frigoritolerans TaxID=450367 RepID=UPI0039A307CC
MHGTVLLIPAGFIRCIIDDDTIPANDIETIQLAIGEFIFHALYVFLKPVVPAI